MAASSTALVTLNIFIINCLEQDPLHSTQKMTPATMCVIGGIAINDERKHIMDSFSNSENYFQLYVN